MMRPAAIFFALALSLAGAGHAQDPDESHDWITLEKPAAGLMITVPMRPNLGLRLAFGGAPVYSQLYQSHLVITFPQDGARIVLYDLLAQPLETIVYAVDGEVYPIAPVVMALLNQDRSYSGTPYSYPGEAGDDSYYYSDRGGAYGHTDDSYEYYYEGDDPSADAQQSEAPAQAAKPAPRPAPAAPAEAPASAGGAGGAGAPSRGVAIGGGTAAAPARPASRQPAARAPASSAPEPQGTDLEALLEEAAPAAGAPPGAEDEAAAEPDLARLRHTGRDLLFAKESEAAGYPLYSYLLIRGGAAGERRQRFERAIAAFIGQVREAAAMEAAGAPRAAINVFYAPTKRFFVDTSAESMRVHFAAQAPARQIELLQTHYDFVRAEVLLDGLGLREPGPYIVTLLEPLSGLGGSREVPWLVQNLSSVPPELVALWVEEFKRQVLQEAQGSPESLRRFALHLRTEVAVLAEAFAITRAAVAEMFAAPGEAAP